MSRSRNSRRGTRAAVQRRPLFGEELRARLGGPTPQACRATHAANDAIAPDPAGEVEADFYDHVEAAMYSDDGLDWCWWDDWKESVA